MLYVKFEILDTAKFKDFQILYEHMVEIREPGFQFASDIEPEIDWDSLKSQEEIDAAVAELSAFSFDDPAEKRYTKLMPEYADCFLKDYLNVDNEKAGALGLLSPLSIFNYLEYGFEVDFDKLEINSKGHGKVDFSTGNYPFGGIERFIMTLRAFDIIATEYYGGFAVNKIEWQSPVEYDTTEIPNVT